MSKVSVEVTAENKTRTGFQSALTDARRFGQEARKSVGGGLSGIGGEIRSSLAGALAGVGIGSFVASTFEKFGRINDLSTQFGVSSEALQKLGQVASESGSSLDQVAVVLSNITKNVEAAKSGTGAAAEALKSLGLSAEDLPTDPIERFLTLSGALTGAGDQGRAYADTLAIIGSKQRDMIGVMREGPSALREQMAGVTVASDEIIKKADEVGDAFSRIGQSFTATLGPGIVGLGQIALSVLATIKAGVEGIVGTLTQSLLGAKNILSGNIAAGARQIMTAPMDNAQSAAAGLLGDMSGIWSPTPKGTTMGLGSEVEGVADAVEKIVDTAAGKVFGPGNSDGLYALEKARADAMSKGPIFGPGTDEAANGGWRVDARDFAMQEAQRMAEEGKRGGFTGGVTASSLQRIAGGEEFARSLNIDPSLRAQEKANAFLQQILKQLQSSGTLILKENS
jgi:hypothetical protein